MISGEAYDILASSEYVEVVCVKRCIVLSGIVRK